MVTVAVGTDCEVLVTPPFHVKGSGFQLSFAIKPINVSKIPLCAFAHTALSAFGVV
ncbi:MAG: hypothetical protein WCG25_07010 [bacterium]